MAADKIQATRPTAGVIAANECDTNADTCCLGKNFVVLEYTIRTADVYAYDKSIKPIEGVPIVTGATAWDHPVTNETFIIVINEALYYGNKLDHSLINPNQIRAYGLDFWDNPFDKQRGLCIEADEHVTIPLSTQGTKVLFNSRAPTDLELNECHRIEITARQEWNPPEVHLSQVNSHPQRHDPQDGLKEKLQALIPRISKISTYDQSLEDVIPANNYTSTARHASRSAATLADRFGIGITRAQDTMRVTTQRGTRSALLPLSRRYRADRRFGVKRLAINMATDALIGPTRSLRGNVAAQVYSHKCGFHKSYSMPGLNGENTGNSLKDFIHEFGAPDRLTFDGFSSQVGRHTSFQKTLRRYDIDAHVSAPYRPNENPAEGAIREIKKAYYRLKEKTNLPDQLWDYALDYVCETSALTTNSSRYSKGRTPIEIITGETPDISEYMDFGLYDWVTYRANAGLGNPELGRWLGISHKVSKAMSYWILPVSGVPISCVTVQRLTNLQRQTDRYKELITAFQNRLTDRWANPQQIAPATLPDGGNNNDVLSLENEDDEFIAEFNRVIQDKDLKEVEDITPDDPEFGTHDPYLNMELALRPNEEEAAHYARVKRRSVDNEGKPLGIPSNNPLTDSRKYDVEFLDGRIQTMSANVIAENLLAQVDDDGHRHLLLDEILDHRTTAEAIPKSKGTYTSQSGFERKKLTTRGWEICVQWKDASTDWIKLKDLKDAYPVPLADYAVANDIQSEPAFAWWVPHTLKKRTAIISKVKSKYWARTHKYGIRVPKSVKEAQAIDRANGNTLWQDAINLEMKNNQIGFEEYQGKIENLIGYEEITAHMIFDVKLAENLRRKARFVADGHKVETPSSITYSTVVSRDSVRIMLMLAALNDLDVMGCDVQNAFLNAKNKEKHWIRAGPEFGHEQDKVFLVVRALYGLKSASAAFRSFMAEKLDNAGFKSTYADPDVWIRPAIKPCGEEYYEYIMCYVDDLIAIALEPGKILADLKGNDIKYKNDEIKPPEMYLGARLKKRDIEGTTCWTITSDDYITVAVATVKQAEAIKRWHWPINVSTPMTASFVPEWDDSPALDSEGITFYQEMIGMLRWATELGRVDILYEVAVLSQYQAAPCEGHIKQAIRIFAYLEKKQKITLYMDHRPIDLDLSLFVTKPDEFKEYYRTAKEEQPHDMPRPRGRAVTTSAYVDSSHGANKVTRRSHSGHILFVNRAPVKWVSRRQNTVETSAFSSEFIAMKQCIEDIEHLRFKLRMFGVPLDEDNSSTYIFCDNEGVVNNSSFVQSTLNKKHSAIAYHFTRWNVAAGVIKVAWIRTDKNIADAMTKRLPELTRDYLYGEWTY